MSMRYPASTIKFEVHIIHTMLQKTIQREA